MSSDVPTSSVSTNIAGIDLALLVDQLTRTGSSPEMTATVLSTLVATSPDAGPDEQKQILQKLTEALRERQRQIELQKVAAVKASSVASAVTSTVTTSQPAVSVSTLSPRVLSTTASVEYKPVITTTKESTSKLNEALLPKTTSTVTLPALSVGTTSSSPVISSSSMAFSTQQWVPGVPISSAVASSSINVSASSSLPVTMAPTSAAVVHPPVTSALPPAVQQILSGQSFENLKNILANVTSRKTAGVGVQDPGSICSTGSVVRTHETLDSYTTSKGSRSDLLRMAPESDLQSKKSPEQDELFVANVHGDVDYRRQPAVPNDPPKTSSLFSVAQPGWIEAGERPLPGILPPPPLPPGLPLPPLPPTLPIQPSEASYVGVGGSRSLLPGPFTSNLSYEAKSSSVGPLLPAPLHTSKPQALLPTPESLKPSADREERGRESREGRKPRSEVEKTNRDQPGYKDKDRRPADEKSSRDDRSSSKDSYRNRQSSREQSDVADRRLERRDGSRSMDQSITQKPASSYRGSEERERSGTKVPVEEGPIVIDDDCEDIPLPPLPPTTAASKTPENVAPFAEGSTRKSQHSETDRKALLPTPAKQDSAGGKRKSDEPRREQKFSRWDHRRSLKTPPSGSKAGPESKGKKALLETPVASGTSESGRAKDSAGDSYSKDAKDSRTAKYDSDSKSYERRRSRSRSMTRHIASNLVDRSRRRLGSMRRHRSSSRDRRRSSHSGSRAGGVHDVRRTSRSRERPAPQSASRERLEEEEKRLRKQLDDLVARKNEGNRGGDRHHSPTYGQEKPADIPSLFDVMQRPDAHINADHPLPRRHLLPAPRLVSANLKGKPLLDLPEVLRPADSDRMRQDVDRERGLLHCGNQPPNQPLLPPAAILPGRPFVQEYSHKPAETRRADQLRFREVIDYTHSDKDAEPNRPTFRDEPSKHRYRPYPVPEDRHRMRPESTERGRVRHDRERQNEQRDEAAKSSDFSIETALDRTAVEKVGLSEASVSEHISTSSSGAEQQKSMWKPITATQPVVSTAAKPELPVVSEESLLPHSSAPSTSTTGDTSVDNKPDSTSTAENKGTLAAAADSPVPQPPLPFPIPPVPPNFPAFVQNIRHMMFIRGRARVPFNPMAAGNMQPPPMPGMFRPPPSFFPVAPASEPCVRPDFPPVITSAIRASAPVVGQTTEASAAVKKPLLGDYPGNSKIPSLMDEGTAGLDSVQSETVQQQHADIPSNEEPAHVQGASLTGAPPKLLEFDQNPNVSSSQLPLNSATVVETNDGLFQADDGSGEHGESRAIRPLMDFNMYGFSSSAQEPRPPQFAPRLMRGPPLNARGRMPLPPRGMPYGSRGRRPAALRGSGDPVPFPRRGGPPFPPRTAPRYPKHQPAPPKLHHYPSE